MPENVLYYGNNLEILRRYIKDESVDLVYLDPAFKSDRDYDILFAERNGSRAAAQIKAFEDTWHWDKASVAAYQEIVETGPSRVSQVMQAFRTFLGENDMMAYLATMAPRLMELQRVIKPRGSIYLHCDPAASHYLKILMDAVFGPLNFKNEIIWHYRKWPTGKYTFQRNHDVLLFYSRSSDHARTFNQLFMERAPSTLRRFGKAKIISGYDQDGRRKPSQTADEESEGVRMDDVWDIGRVPPIKQLFPTQKPEPLLERIIRGSSNEGDLVLDPFCGCGTAIVASETLKRKWIGIDITHIAVTLIKHRLYDMFGSQVQYKVVGEPVSLPDAKALAENDPYQFQWWARGLVGARPIDEKKGADRGIDGRLYFHDEPDSKKGATKQIILSVKSGRVSVKDVRDLRGVLERENAQIGVLICMEKPTRYMRRESASAGFYKSHWGTHSKLQIVTIEELLTGHKIDYPDIAGVNVTFRQAQKPKPKQKPHPELDYPQQ
jgi:DNA modification methylase